MPIPINQQPFCASSNGTGTVILPSEDLSEICEPPYRVGFWMQLREYPPPYDGQTGYGIVLDMEGFFFNVSGQGSATFWVPWFDEGGSHYSYPSSGPGVIKTMQWQYIEFTVNPGGLTLAVDGDDIPLLDAQTPTDRCLFPCAIGGFYHRSTFQFSKLAVDITDLRIWNTPGTADQALLNQYLIPTDPQNDPTLLLFYDFSVNPPVLRKNTPGVGTSPSFNGGAAMSPLGVPCQASILAEMFGGDYDSAVMDASGIWLPQFPALGIRVDGAMYGSTAIVGEIIDCDGVHWPAEGNPFACSGWLLPSSANPKYWGSARQSRPCLEGVISTDGSTFHRFRAVRRPQRGPAFVIMNDGHYLVATSATNVSLVAGTSPRGLPTYWWQQLDDGTFWNTGVHAVLDVNGPAVAGAGVLMGPSGPNATKWSANGDGSFGLLAAPDLCLARVGEALVLQARQSPLGTGQSWRGFRDSVPIFDYQGRSLRNLGGTVACQGGGIPDAWYLAGDAILSTTDGTVLTASGLTPGAQVALTSWTSDRVGQRWQFEPTAVSLVDNPDLVLSSDGAGNVTLQTRNANSANQSWSITTPRHLQRPRVRRLEALSTTRPEAMESIPGPLEPATDVTYEITIQTSSDWLSGTGKHATIYLMAPQGGQTLYFEIIATVDFPASSLRVFSVKTNRFNGLQITGVQLCDGDGIAPEWKPDWVEIFDTSLGTVAHFDIKQWISGFKAFEKPTITLGVKELRLSFFPGQIVPFGITCASPPILRLIDHTFVVLHDTETDKVTFGCAGGDTPCAGDALTPDVLTTRAVVTDVVRMATGLDVSTGHPLQSSYGLKAVEKNVNANVDATGTISRGGYCHQIANRLLYTGSPRKTITSLDTASWPRGYTLSCLLFGEFSPEFDKWCTDHGFPAPDSTLTQRLSCMQKILPHYPRGVHENLVYLYETFRSHYIDCSEFLPKGAGIQQWYQELRRDNTTCQLNITETDMQRLFKGEI